MKLILKLKDEEPKESRMLLLQYRCGRCTIKYNAIDDPLRCKEHPNFCAKCDAEVHNVRLSLPPELDHSSFLAEGMIGEIEDA